MKTMPKPGPIIDINYLKNALKLEQRQWPKIKPSKDFIDLTIDFEEHCKKIIKNVLIKIKNLFN